MVAVLCVNLKSHNSKSCQLYGNNKVVIKSVLSLIIANQNIADQILLTS